MTSPIVSSLSVLDPTVLETVFNPLAELWNRADATLRSLFGRWKAGVAQGWGPLPLRRRGLFLSMTENQVNVPSPSMRRFLYAPP